MPFTVSHVAAVLPFSRWLTRRHILSAAVIGSMTPDLSMLLPGHWPRWQTHSLLGAVEFCLPLGLAMYWLTQWLIKPAVAEMLPPPQRARLLGEHPSVRARVPLHWLAASLAILFGALTHLLWDAFTHEESRFVRMLPWLNDFGPDMGGHPMRLYRWLQHGSSVVGLIAVLVAVWLWYVRASQTSPAPRSLSTHERHLWIAGTCGAILLVVVLKLFELLARGVSFFNTSEALTELAVSGVRATALAVVLASALLKLRLLNNPR